MYENELNAALKAAGVSECTGVDKLFEMQEAGAAFIAVDYDEQYDFDDMLERCAGGQSCFLTTIG